MKTPQEPTFLTELSALLTFRVLEFILGNTFLFLADMAETAIGTTSPAPLTGRVRFGS